MSLAKEKAAVDRLDLSGGPNSWFDLWHIHIDWSGEGNKDWETRQKLLAELLELYSYLKLRLKTFEQPFHLFIVLDGIDSGQDAVYVHTANPNNHAPFPLLIPHDPSLRPAPRVEEYISSLGMEMLAYNTTDGPVFYLFDPGVGVPLGRE
jgi:hypothetical protein